MAVSSLDRLGYCTVVVEKLDLDTSPANRLKSLGVFEGQQIQLTRMGNPLIIKAAGSRIAIAKAIAQRILVRDLDV